MKGNYLEIETERLILKPFKSLTEEQKEELIKSWDNPFNARFNAEPDSRKSVENLMVSPEPTFTNIGAGSEYYSDTMFFRVAYDKITGELIGSCRFGKYPGSETMVTWDFGFNVLLKQWSKGYGTEMVKKIIEITKFKDAKFLRGWADNDNFGSYHAMIKNGFKYIGIDDDEDFEFELDLSKPKLSEEEIEENWQKHIRRYIRRFGKKRYSRLQEINRKIKEMVKRIQAGEDEDTLVQEYFEECNTIEPFPMD